jgi:MoxR-like ATPase
MATKPLHVVPSPEAPVAPGTFGELRAALRSAYVERSDIIEALLACAVAGEHAFILGPPGTAKSALVRSVSNAFGLRYWEVLMTRFSTPEEIFGPVKLSALQKDSYERAIDKYLPTAEVAFLDECWKSNSGVLNALLTLLNERTFHNGGVPVGCPLVSCIGASNELPEGPELEVLYDRFLVRLHVNYIADRDNFLSMLRAPEPVIPMVTGLRSEQGAARMVVLDDKVFEALADMRQAVQKHGLRVSDRRWRKCLPLVQAATHLDGRTHAEPDDLGVLEHVLWSSPDERSTVAKLVQKVVNPNAARAVECLDSAREARNKVPGTVTRQDLPLMSEINETLEEIANRLDTLGTGRKVVAIKEEVARIRMETSKIAAKAMGMKL